MGEGSLLNFLLGFASISWVSLIGAGGSGPLDSLASSDWLLSKCQRGDLNPTLSQARGLEDTIGMA